MSVEVDVQYAAPGPPGGAIQNWARAAIARERPDGELTVRIVDEDEGRRLNERWRKGKGATDVLSFPCELPPGVPCKLLGDVVICAPVAQRKAQEQGRDDTAYWAHLVVHGTLHLLGYDHQQEDEAQRMEAREAEILGRLGFPDPYR